MKAVAFVVAVAVVCGVAFGETWTSGDLTCEIKDDTLTCSGSGYMDNYSEYTTPGWASHKDDFTKVVLKGGAKSIGEYAFYGNDHLVEVTTDSSFVQIDRNAFQGCKNLTKLTINGNMEYIGNDAFKQSGIVELTISSNNATLSSNIFDTCNDLDTVVIKGKYVAVLPASLFNDCKKLKRVVIPYAYEVDDDVFTGDLDDLSLVYYTGSSDPCKEGTEAFSSSCPVRYVVVPTNYNSNKFCEKHAKVVSTTTDGASSVVVSALVMLLSVFLYLW